MSKLYTEEQVRVMLSKARFQDYNDEDLYPADYLIEEQTPIELPTNKVIEKVAEKTLSVDFLSFIEGAKWMRDKIKGGGE